MIKTGMIVSAIFYCSQCIAQSSGNYIISGNIQGIKSDTAYLSYESVKKVRYSDTTIIKDGRFTYRGTVGQPLYAFITIGRGNRRIASGMFIEPGKIKIKGNLAVSTDIRITGTLSNNKMDSLSQSESVVYAEIKKQYNTFEALKKNQDSAAARETTRKQDSVENALGRKLVKIRTDFIKANPASLASGIAIYLLEDGVTWQELESLYLGLSPAVRRFPLTKGIPDKITAGKRIDINQSAPEFTLTDTSGNPVSLSSFRGRYVLLDFWASWCVPCRQENKNVLLMFNKYKEKNFVIIGLSVDATTMKWKEAVHKDGLPWINVCDSIQGAASVPHLYGVQPIPDNFLIDPSGKIIGRRLFGDQLDKKLAGIL